MSALNSPLMVSKPTLTLESIRELVAEDLKIVTELITNDYYSKVPLINQITDYIVQCGGKHLRPLILLLMSKALGYEGTAAPHLATAIEFVHTATLLHDDVIDESGMRRGRKTANVVWNNASTILVGDFLYSRAFQKIAHLENIPITAILRAMSKATNLIVEGEVIQLINRHNPHITEEVYLTILHCKTGKLFEVAAHIGTLLGDAPPHIQHAACEYGKHLGIAFQLVDDMLDYRADPEKTGKNIGDDLAEGSPTLPLIYALEHAKPAEREKIQKAIENSDASDIKEIIRIVESSGALAYTAQKASEQAERAITVLASLPASPYRDALVALADFAIHRDH